MCVSTNMCGYIKVCQCYYVGIVCCVTFLIVPQDETPRTPPPPAQDETPRTPPPPTQDETPRSPPPPTQDETPRSPPPPTQDETPRSPPPPTQDETPRSPPPFTYGPNVVQKPLSGVPTDESHVVTKVRLYCVILTYTFSCVHTFVIMSISSYFLALSCHHHHFLVIVW